MNLIFMCYEKLFIFYVFFKFSFDAIFSKAIFECFCDFKNIFSPADDLTFKLTIKKKNLFNIDINFERNNKKNQILSVIT